MRANSEKPLWPLGLCIPSHSLRTARCVARDVRRICSLRFACVRAWVRRAYREEECSRALFFGTACFYSMTQPAAGVIWTNPGDFPSHTSHSHVSRLAACASSSCTSPVICFTRIVSLFFSTSLNMFHRHKHKVHLISLSSFPSAYVTEGFFFLPCTDSER